MRNKTLIAGLTTLAAFAVGCGAGSDDTAGPGVQDEKKGGGKKVVLEVKGPKTADVTYGLGTDQSQENGAKLPWKKEMTSSEDVLIASLVAQSKGTGEITCTITVDGKVAKTNKSSGEFAVVTCDADAS